MKLDYKKTFLIGFGFFGISVMWTLYNAYRCSSCWPCSACWV